MRAKKPLLHQRAHSYKLLSECYYPPNDKLLEKLNSRGESIESLKVDFSRLFVGPFKLLAPPYGSLYLEKSGMVMGKSTLDAKRRYREEGLDISFKEAPDHIAIELEFMYFLIFREIEAISDSNSGQKAAYLKKQASFLKDHLGAWVPEFTGAVEANAATYFYRNLARLTKTLIEDERKNRG